MAMLDQFKLLSGWRSLIAAAALLTAAATTPALAQHVVVIVNGEPITALDIEQRSKFIQLSTHKAPPRQEVLDELIDEKLKVKEAKRWGIDIPDSEVDSRYAAMGSRLRVTADQLTQTLAKAGVSGDTLKARIRADIAWQALVRGRYQATLQLNDKDVQFALETKKIEDKDTSSFDYIMRPILFIVPPGSPEPVVAARRKEAEALRARFRDCHEGLALARTMRDVAVRDQVIRSSGDLTPELRKVLDEIPIGQLTAPEVTRLGVEMFALCSKQESKADSPGKRRAREAVYNERFEEQSKRYLKQLRSAAMIEQR
jgi:peptidyl-prolyl cis-trans isomerase SurA